MLRTQNTSGQVTNFYGNTIGATYEFSPTNAEREKFPNSLVIIMKYMEYICMEYIRCYLVSVRSSTLSQSLSVNGLNGE